MPRARSALAPKKTDFWLWNFTEAPAIVLTVHCSWLKREQPGTRTLAACRQKGCPDHLLEEMNWESEPFVCFALSFFRSGTDVGPGSCCLLFVLFGLCFFLFLCWFVWLVVVGSTLASLLERGFLTMVPACARTKQSSRWAQQWI